jgi:hypothetical protein
VGDDSGHCGGIQKLECCYKCSRAAGLAALMFATTPMHYGGIMNTILILVVILLLIGALPTWPYSSSWGYYPSGGLGLVAIIVIVLLVTGRL